MFDADHRATSARPGPDGPRKNGGRVDRSTRDASTLDAFAVSRNRDINCVMHPVDAVAWPAPGMTICAAFLQRAANAPPHRGGVTGSSSPDRINAGRSESQSWKSA